MGLFGPPSIKKLEAKRDIAALIRALSEADLWRSRDAVVALATIGGPSAVDALIGALREGPVSTRLVAAEALGRIGAVEGVPALIEALTDDAQAVGDDPQYSPWSQHSSGRYLRVSGVATHALQVMGPPALDALVAALSQDDPRPLVMGETVGIRVRTWAARILGQIGDPRAVEPLCAALGDEDSSVRDAAARALGVLKDERAVEPLIAAVKVWGGRAGEAVWALGELGDQRANEAVIGWLDHALEGGVGVGIEALGKLGPREVVLPIIHQFWFQAMDASSEAAAARRRGHAGSNYLYSDPAEDAGRNRLYHLEGIVHEAETRLRAGHKRRRPTERRHITRLKETSTVEVLIARLDDSSEGSRAEAEEAIVSLGAAAAHTAVDLLVARVENTDGEAVATAARILTRLGNARGSAWVLSDAARRDERGLYEKAARNLERAGAEAVPLLRAAAHDESAGVRWSVAHVLGRSGAEEAVPLLIELLDDDDEGVRDAAMAGLRRIGGPDADAAIGADRSAPARRPT